MADIIIPFTSVGGYSTGLTAELIVEEGGGTRVTTTAGATFSGTVSMSGGLCASGGITFNGTVTGVTATFSRLTTHNAGLTTSFLFASSGSTFGSTLQVSGGATLASTLDVTGVARFAGGVTFSGTTDHAGVNRFAGGVTFSGQVNATTFKLNTVGGDEGGQIDFGIAATNTSLTGGVAIDIYQNKLRFFESGGNNRGAYLDLTNLPSGVGTDLANRATTTPIGITNATNLYAITYPDGITSNRSDRTAWYRSFVETIIDGAGRAVRANRTYFRIQNVNKDTAIKSVRITSANTGTTGNCYFSIWSCDPTSGFPNTRLYLSASTAVGSGYNKTTVTNASGLVTVPSGKWWLAVTFDSTPTVYCGSAYYYNAYLGAPDYYSGYRFQGAIADTSTYTVPSAIPSSGVTFGFIEYAAGQNYFDGAIGLEWIPV